MAPLAPGQPQSTLNLDDPWVASALAVEIKAHIEAAPADAERIKARGFAVKTVGDLAQYRAEAAPVVQNARLAARTRKLAARAQPVAQAVTGEAVHEVIIAQPIGPVS